MVTDVHAKIHAFLQQCSMVKLHGHTPQMAISAYNKAGVVPFLRGRPWKFLLMKPVAKHAHLSPPAFQLCKGTRMQHLPSGWRDIRDSETPTGGLEPLPVTALREGLEELGLVPSSITKLIDVGPYVFSSAISADAKHMWLYAAQVEDEAALLPHSEIASTTAAREWMSLETFARHGRADHRPILEDIATRLAAHYGE